MTDEIIKNALLSITKFNEQTLEGHIALVRFIARKLPDLSQDERAELLIGVEFDQKRLNTLKVVLQTL